MKILLGWFGHETNTFSRIRTDFRLLTSQGSWEGQEILDVFRDTPSYMGGMIKRAEESGAELIPSFAVENAGPTISDECLEQVCDKLLYYVKKHHGQYQGIALGLHGAGCSESCDDIETYVLRRIREVVGEKMPIVSTLDLHGNITQGMCDNALLFGIKNNPHTDYATSGWEAMDTLIRTISGELKNPVTEVIPLPMLVPITVTSDYQNISNYLREYKKEHNLLDLCFFPGFPYTDSSISKASVFVTSDGGAMDHAKKIAHYIWNHRNEIVNMESYNAEEALSLAQKWLNTNKEGICLINEEADNPGAGAPGDGTPLIRAMIEANIKDSAFAYIYDPEVVQAAMNAGIGAKITIELGGKVEDRKYHGDPLLLKDVEVKTLSDGSFIATTPLMKGIPGSFGPTVGLRYRNVDFVVASVQNQTYDDRAFFVGNIDFKEKRLIALKSSQHFKAFFGPNVQHVIAANPTGISTRNLSLFDYEKIERPIFPLDKDTYFSI